MPYGKVFPVSDVYQLQAPRHNGEILAYPTLDDIARLVERNRKSFAKSNLNTLGRDLQSLRNEAAARALTAAKDYFAEAGEPLPDFSGASIFLAGHQPELFHPGVWIKNFALNRLARECSAVPMNLIVDNDAVKSTTLAAPDMIVPPPDIAEFAPKLRLLAFDQSQGNAPSEEYTVKDESFFQSFPGRVPRDWGFEPMLSEFWREVCRQAQRTPLLGERFAAARRVYERRWGCHNLELPVSRLCDTAAYGWFFLHVLAELPRFHHVHNRAVHAYRRRHGIDSKNHPVPDLTRDGDWFEAPFWSWRSGAAKRERLFVQHTRGPLELRAGNEHWSLSLPFVADRVAGAWERLKSFGVKIRSRALTNTLFARVFVGDLFMHGIGGGKYDELTDDLIRDFYGIEPPGYAVVSGTLQLPFPLYHGTEEDSRKLWHRLRELRFNPQRHLAEADIDATAAKLIAEKQEWIEKRWRGREEREQRFANLREITNRLRRYLQTQEELTNLQWRRCRQQVVANKVLLRRDYAFCFYPEELIRGFCTQVLDRKED